MKWKRFGFLLMFLLLFSIRAQAQFSSTTNMGMKKPNTGLTSGWDVYLNGNFDQLDAYLGGVSTLTQNSATPSVSANWSWKTGNTALTTITNFTSGFSGQHITILCADSFTTLASNATLSLSAPFVCTGVNSISLVLNGSVWTETSRFVDRVLTLPSSRITRICMADGSATTGTIIACVGDKIQVIATITGAASITATATQPPLSQMSTGSASSIIGYQSATPVNYFTGNNILYLAGVRVDDWNATPATWNERIMFGVGSTTTYSGGSDTPTGWAAFFRASSNVPDTNFQCMVANNAAATATDSGVAVDAAFHRFEIQFRDSIPDVLFLIDGVRRCVVTTGIPTGSHAMRRFMSVQPLTAVSKNLSVAYDVVQTD